MMPAYTNTRYVERLNYRNLALSSLQDSVVLRSHFVAMFSYALCLWRESNVRALSYARYARMERLQGNCSYQRLLVVVCAVLKTHLLSISLQIGDPQTPHATFPDERSSESSLTSGGKRREDKMRVGSGCKEIEKMWSKTPMRVEGGREGGKG